MENIWNTVFTILATGLLIYGGYFLRDYLQAKREAERQKTEREREVRDARRKYREDTIAPVRDKLVEIKQRLGSRWIFDVIEKARNQGITLTPETEALINEYEREILPRREARDLSKLNSELEPLSAPITDDHVRETINYVFLLSSVGKDVRDKLIEIDGEDNISKKFNLAFKKLEDYVALAD